jgi:hypothetical protein
MMEDNNHKGKICLLIIRNSQYECIICGKTYGNVKG